MTDADETGVPEGRAGRLVVRLLHGEAAARPPQVANALVVLYGVVVLGSLMTLPLFLTPGHAVAGVTCAVVTATSAVSALLVRSGRRGLGLALFFALLLGGNLAAFVVGRDARLTAVYLVIPVAVAVVTLAVPWVVAVSVVSVGMGVVGTALEPPLDPPVTGAEIVTAAVVLTSTVLVTGLLGVWGQRREALRADSEARRATGLAQHLQAVNAELEARVAARTDDLQRALARQETLVADLAELSLRDPLTGLHNRRHADAELPRLVREAVRTGRPLALAIADLDRFKQVNDDHSYGVGDEVLRRFAQVLQDSARSTDLVARYGGEEFLVVMPGTTLEQAQALAERLRAGVERHPWPEVVDGLAVTVSLGLADTGRHPGLVPLVAAADAALHAAKRRGRNQVVLAEPGPGGEVPTTAWD